MKKSALRRRRALAAIGILAAFSFFAAACGDDGGDASTPDDGSGNGSGDETDAGEPQSGGSITYGMYSAPRGLDPIAASGDGTAGGIELMALYDTIMQWNGETGEYEPRTAESLESNDDFTEWTLTLQDGITFRDGTPYNAEAVRLSFERHMSAENTTNPSRAHLSIVDTVEVVDDLTVRFTLNAPWPYFAFLLADEPGMLVSPTALAALGDPASPDYKQRKDAFNLNPVGAGAGPFEIVSFRPGEGIVMEKNPDYWGGEVYLDEVEFVVATSSSFAYESLQSGEYDMAFLRSAPVSNEAKEQFGTIETIKNAGEILLLNQGVPVTCRGGEPAPLCTGQEDGAQVPTDSPTANPKVRQAIAAAIDPNVINERAYEGEALSGTQLFQEGFRWYPGVEGPEYDPERAAELVEEAKAEGWDGSIDLVCTNAPDRVASALAIETMLESVGMEVNAETDLDVQRQIQKVIAQKDFDMACWGIALSSDPAAALGLRQNFYSTSATNRVGFESADMDAAIDEAQSAESDEEITEAYGRIAEVYREELPVLVLAAVPEVVTWVDSVHGVYMNHSSMNYLDKVWVEQ
jgi:peptide/nickel transport system substrate-binding protein